MQTCAGIHELVWKIHEYSVFFPLPSSSMGSDANHRRTSQMPTVSTLRIPEVHQELQRYIILCVHARGSILALSHTGKAACSDFIIASLDYRVRYNILHLKASRRHVNQLLPSKTPCSCNRLSLRILAMSAAEYTGHVCIWVFSHHIIIAVASIFRNCTQISHAPLNFILFLLLGKHWWSGNHQYSESGNELTCW